MNISQPARNAALRIAQQHIDMDPKEKLLGSIAAEIQTAIDTVRAHESCYFIMQEDSKPQHSFWDGEKWTGPKTRKVYNDFDEAVKEYRRAFLKCEGKVTVAHSTPAGITRYQPL